MPAERPAGWGRELGAGAAAGAAAAGRASPHSSCEDKDGPGGAAHTLGSCQVWVLTLKGPREPVDVGRCSSPRVCAAEHAVGTAGERTLGHKNDRQSCCAERHQFPGDTEVLARKVHLAGRRGTGSAWGLPGLAAQRAKERHRATGVRKPGVKVRPQRAGGRGGGQFGGKGKEGELR